MKPIKDALAPVLTRFVPQVAAQSILATLPATAQNEVGSLDTLTARELLARLEVGLKLFAPRATPDAMPRLREALTGGRALAPARAIIPVRSDRDVVTAQHQTLRMMSPAFRSLDAVRVGTAVSELARNIYMYAGRGTLTLELAESSREVVFSVLAEDRGPGIPHLDRVLDGTYVSTTGLGKGLRGARTFLDDFHIESSPAGTTVRGLKRRSMEIS